MVLLSASCSDDFPKIQAYSNQIPIWKWTKIGIQKYKFPIGTTNKFMNSQSDEQTDERNAEK